VRWKRSSILFCVLMLVGCATTGKPRHGDWAPVDSERALKRAVATMNDLSHRRRSLRAQVKVAAPFLPGKTAADGVVVAQPVDALRLDLMDPVGGTLAGVNLQRDTLALWLPNEQRLYETDSLDDSLTRLTRLPWTLSELFSILQGLPPKRFNESYYDWFIGADGTAVNSNGDAAMAIVPAMHLPHAFIRYTNEQHKKVIYEVKYDEYRPTKLGMFPHHITVQFFSPRKKVEMWFDNVEWNPTIAWGALALDVPEGTKVVRVQ
jgi:hypothetical protein